ncbi:hypothetical protein L7F22_059476 [Adiantum nelumboides]|nr:hypothetical protein [Adiantum nelumboides]
MPLLYVLLFPRGEYGWHLKLPYADVDVPTDALTNRQCVSHMEYYAYHLQVRLDTNACLLRGGRLLQQFMVDAYCTIEDCHLSWVRNHQHTSRAELYAGLIDMARSNEGDILGQSVGQRIVLPSLFTGGPRHMYQLYQDAMAIVRAKGKPDLFITFTCNPNWPEVTQALLPGQVSVNRPDIMARVFFQKHSSMMRHVLKQNLFGKVVDYMSVVEFQKRGLPHSHTLLILDSICKPRTTSDYDRMVCAELPDKGRFPMLHDTIVTCNIHGPCKEFNQSAPCMANGQCTKRYPRPFCEHTTVDTRGYPVYIRQDNGSTARVKGCTIDNRWVIPYNPVLSLMFNAHINVEVCSTIQAIKYVYKYIYKGHDRATVRFHAAQDDGQRQHVDEIDMYLDGRYVSASEACWRIFDFPLHSDAPEVQRLSVHVPSGQMVTFQDHGQMVTFQDHDRLGDVLQRDTLEKTTLTEWFACNVENLEANDTLYIDFSQKWVWNSSSKKWTKRRRGDTIGRMYFVQPSAGERYYVRLLLTICKGCKSFKDLQTVNGVVFPTFKAACIARGVLEDDGEWSSCIEEACMTHTGGQLRHLFVTILLFCVPSSPQLLWERFRQHLSEDYSHALVQQFGCFNDCAQVAEGCALRDLHTILATFGRSLHEFPGIPFPNQNFVQPHENSLLFQEQCLDRVRELTASREMEETLNQAQRCAFHTVLDAIAIGRGSIFFLDGPVGTGKTYLYNCLLSRVRGEGAIALATASSGISALLLKNGRTAHSRFKIPLDVDNCSTCNIPVQGHLAELIRVCKLIVWDEAPMTNQNAFEAFDRTLQDIMCSRKFFGGKVLLLGGDFKQILPVVPKGSRPDIVNATLCCSYLWPQVTVLRLFDNMRMRGDDIADIAYRKWLMDVGNGTLTSHEDHTMAIPSDMVLSNQSMDGLISYVYSDMNRHLGDAIYYRDRAILAPRNSDVDIVNAKTLCAMSGDIVEYFSADSIIEDSMQQSFLYSVEFLNGLNLGGGFPIHYLQLKLNAPIILLRNLDPNCGLCNGTRLVCKAFHQRVLEAEIVTGTCVGTRVFIPRICFIYSGTQLPFVLRRWQFPVRLAFGMTINKSQGQSIAHLGLYLVTPVFTHGQLYVALSRARSAMGVKIVLSESDGSEARLLKTVNVVYSEILNNTM